MGKILRFTSPQFRLRILGPAEPYSTIIDDWVFQEHYADPWPRRETDRPYFVTLEHELALREDAGSMYINGEYHVYAFEKAWLYGTGTTMAGSTFDFMLQPARLPHEWTANAAEVLPETDWTLVRDGASYTPKRRTAPTLPLRLCTDVLMALAEADDLTVQLTAYHFGAVTSHDREVALLLIAQGLEVERALLPGKTKQEQEAQLPESVKARLARGLDWLFNMSNQRRQTRHAIDKQRTIELKPDFTWADEEAYFHDGSLILQHTISNRLDLPLIVFEDGATVGL